MDDSVDDDGAGDDGINNIGGTRGVWYKVLGSNDAPLVASTCHPGTTFDTVLSVYHSKSPESCIGNYTRVATNDDSCGEGGRQSSVTWASTSNSEYLIFIQGNGNAVGDFVLTVSQTVPNDLCETAIGPLGLPHVASGTTENATEDINSAPMCGNDDAFRAVRRNGPGVWYSVLGTGRTLVEGMDQVFGIVSLELGVHW